MYIYMTFTVGRSQWHIWSRCSKKRRIPKTLPDKELQRSIFSNQ